MPIAIHTITLCPGVRPEDFEQFMNDELLHRRKTVVNKDGMVAVAHTLARSNRTTTNKSGRAHLARRSTCEKRASPSSSNNLRPMSGCPEGATEGRLRHAHGYTVTPRSWPGRARARSQTPRWARRARRGTGRLLTLIRYPRGS